MGSRRFRRCRARAKISISRSRTRTRAPWPMWLAVRPIVGVLWLTAPRCVAVAAAAATAMGAVMLVSLA